MNCLQVVIIVSHYSSYQLLMHSYMQSYKAQQTMLLCLFFHFFYHLYKMQINTLIDRQLKRDVQKQSWSQLLANNWTYKLHDQQYVIENTIELQQSCIRLLLVFSFLVVFRFQIHSWVVIRSQAFRRNFQIFDKTKQGFILKTTIGKYK